MANPIDPIEARLATLASATTHLHVSPNFENRLWARLALETQNALKSIPKTANHPVFDWVLRHGRLSMAAAALTTVVAVFAATHSEEEPADETLAASYLTLEQPW